MVVIETETLYGLLGVAVVQVATILLTVIKMRSKANGSALATTEERIGRLEERCRRLEVDLEACTSARMLLEADKHRLMDRLFEMERGNEDL